MAPRSAAPPGLGSAAERLDIASVECSSLRALRLAETIHPRYRALVLLGGYGGLRIGELAGLRRGPIGLARDTITVYGQVTEVAGSLALVFTSPRGGRLSPTRFRTCSWVPAVEAAGLVPAPRVHDLRHTAICGTRR
jgi:integrase